MKHEKSCGAVIIHNQSVLLEHQTNDHWSFPKGHTEPGETETDTALREIKEETNLDVKLDESIRYSFSYVIQDRQIDKEVVVFAATLKDSHQSMAKQDSEIAELRWVPFDKVETTFTREAYRQAWREIFRQLQAQHKI